MIILHLIHHHLNSSICKRRDLCQMFVLFYSVCFLAVVLLLLLFSSSGQSPVDVQSIGISIHTTSFLFLYFVASAVDVCSCCFVRFYKHSLMLLLSLSRALSQLIPSLHSFLSCSENFFFFSSLPPFHLFVHLHATWIHSEREETFSYCIKKNSKIYIHTHITEELLLFDSIRARISLASFSCRTSNAVLSDDGLIWPCHAFVCSIVRSIVHHTVLTHTHRRILIRSRSFVCSFVRCLSCCGCCKSSIDGDNRCEP